MKNVRKKRKNALPNLQAAARRRADERPKEKSIGISKRRTDIANASKAGSERGRTAGDKAVSAGFQRKRETETAQNAGAGTQRCLYADGNAIRFLGGSGIQNLPCQKLPETERRERDKRIRPIQRRGACRISAVQILQTFAQIRCAGLHSD